MRLLLLSTEFPPGPGGIGTHAYQLTNHLVKLGWDVTVVTRQDYVSVAEYEQFNSEQPFRIITLPPIKSSLMDALSRWRIMKEQISSTKPYLIVVTGAQSVWVAGALGNTLPKVAIGHGTEFGLMGWRYRLTKHSFETADQVVCVSEYTQKYMLEHAITPKQTAVIHNGGDSEHFRVLSDVARQEYREEAGFASSKVLLTVGNVTERKGQDVVIRAMPRILEHFPDVHYVIAGLPTLKQEFQALTEALHVEKHVHFLGRVSSTVLLNLYNLCDLFIMMSRHTEGDFEGYGIAVIEAMACGVAPVATDIPGAQDVIEVGVSGLLVPPEDADKMAMAIRDLYQSPTKRRAMGEAARQRILAHYRIEREVQQHEAVYADILKLPAKPSL